MTDCQLLHDSLLLGRMELAAGHDDIMLLVRLTPTVAPITACHYEVSEAE
jgi:hypothetical protein